MEATNFILVFFLSDPTSSYSLKKNAQLAGEVSLGNESSFYDGTLHQSVIFVLYKKYYITNITKDLYVLSIMGH